MVFFGLTQLGPRSTFNASLISLQNYSSFAATAQGCTSYLDGQGGPAEARTTAFVAPILGSMECGWNAPTADYATERHLKVSSAETWYTDSMVRHGEEFRGL
jgi:hypothetical protein